MSALPPSAAVAVFGAGAMGAGIAQVAAQAGHRVQLFDSRINAAVDAKKKIGETFATLAGKGKLTDQAAKDAAARIEAVHAVGHVVSAKLVIEAIVEDLSIKRDLFHELEVVVADDAILATNTSSLSVTALATGLRCPKRLVGMHFFNPAPILPLVEVVSGLATDRGVAETIYDTAKAWGKTPVHAMSTPGFIVNRCARPFYAEGLRLLAERAADPATIDAVMRDAGGFRMGPFELMDMIGHDVNFAVTKSVWEAYFHDARFTPSVVQQELVAAGYLGRKSGRGFYDHAKEATVISPRTEPPRPCPQRVVAYGDLGFANALVDRIAALGVPLERAERRPGVPSGVIAAGGAWLALSDGRTATGRGTEGVRDLVLFDLALDYHAAKRLAVARADTCSDAAFGAAVGLLQAAGIAVSPIDDVAGLPVLRTVAMLVNEAADAVVQGIASASDIDLAMQMGVNYPRGPLAWGDDIGCAFINEVLVNLIAHYGDARYRISPLIARRCAAGAPLLS
ncbi:MAG TPA: 3-hydroxyacyl-CoA dehydrogenase PaaH [Casimicrobiaceae bacterium]|nr:3-hydroxyacyl-CoA dehydrogenase PaaH [Casimicrobiaceae bacterium]